jgi:signal transduction histidine kinase
MERLFETFRQLDGGTSKKYQGTGLGLALTKRLVEAQGGHIGVSSSPGVGSVFFAVLPRIGVLHEASPAEHLAPSLDANTGSVQTEGV